MTGHDMAFLLASCFQGLSLVHESLEARAGVGFRGIRAFYCSYTYPHHVSRRTSVSSPSPTSHHSSPLLLTRPAGVLRLVEGFGGWGF